MSCLSYLLGDVADLNCAILLHVKFNITSIKI